MAKEEQIMKASCLLLTLGLSGCVSQPKAEETPPVRLEWLTPSGGIVPRASDRIDPLKYSEVRDHELSKALELLKDSSAIELVEADSNQFFPASSASLPKKNRYLVRAEKDDLAGTYSVFLNNESALVFYNHLGGCGNETRTALIVVTDAPIRRAFGGCSSAK